MISSLYSVTGQKTGGNARYNSIAMAFKELGFRVNSLALKANQDFSDNSSQIEEYSFGTSSVQIGASALIDMSPRFIACLKRVLITIKPRIVVVSSPPGLISARFCQILSDQKIPIIYDAANVERAVFMRIKEQKASIAMRIFSMDAAQSFIEYFVIKIADYIFCTGQSDIDLFKNKYHVDDRKLIRVPSSRMQAKILSSKERNNLRTRLGIRDDDFAIIFHGSYSHPPNREAFDLMRQELAPSFLETNENIKFFFFGTSAPIVHDKNFFSLGQVNEIDPILSSMDLAIIPLNWGGGTKLKTLDYLANGLPIATTSEGITGLPLIMGTDYVKVDSLNQFHDCILELYHSSAYRLNLGENARKRFTSQLSNIETRESLRKFISSVGGLDNE